MKLPAAFSALLLGAAPAAEPEEPQPFGPEFPGLDSLATGPWWTRQPKGPNPPPKMDVPRDQVVAFALYTVTVLCSTQDVVNSQVGDISTFSVTWPAVGTVTKSTTGTF